MPAKNWSNMIEMDAAFYERVYGEVAKIPFGRVSTYGKIAELAGYPAAAREVGVALSRVTKVQAEALPCHRVVNKNGTLAPSYAFGGKEKQRAMLQAEGITFLSDGCINMARHVWPPEPGGEQISFWGI